MDVDVTQEDGSKWRLTRIYGESEAARKKETWRTLGLLNQQHHDGRPWLCVGDFNEILASSEKVGGCRPTTSMHGLLQGCFEPV